MGIKRREKVQAKDIENIFNKITKENVPTLEKVVPTQVQETSRTLERWISNEMSCDVLSSNALKYRKLKLQERKAKSHRKATTTIRDVILSKTIFYNRRHNKKAPRSKTKSKNKKQNKGIYRYFVGTTESF